MLRSFGKMFEPLLDSWAKAYQKQVGAELKKYGLRVDDLLDQDADPEVVDARMQRQKRAMDLSMKHEYLPKEMQEQQTPFQPYLRDELARVEAEEAERFSVGAGSSRDRSIP